MRRLGCAALIALAGCSDAPPILNDDGVLGTMLFTCMTNAAPPGTSQECIAESKNALAFAHGLEEASRVAREAGIDPLESEPYRRYIQGICDAWRRGVDEPIAGSAPVHGAKEPDVDYTRVCARTQQSRVAVEPTAVVARWSIPPLLDLDDTLPCGESDEALTLCASPSFPPGPAVSMMLVVDAEIPRDDATYSHQFGFVFDSDGDTANNYRAAPAYPNDFFQATDRWYVAGYTPAGGWTIEVSDVRGGTPRAMPSQARISIIGAAMMLHVPADELPTLPACPGARITTFTHTGDFGLQGGPWSADTEPTVDEPLDSGCVEVVPVPVEVAGM